MDAFPPIITNFGHVKARHPQANRHFKVPISRTTLIWATLTAIAILTLVLPLAVMFGRSKKASPKVSVLVPLYTDIYSITTYPVLNVTVVVNPASGPGPDALPDANYMREIPKLNAYPNVRTVGYVSTNYTSRNLDLVLRDIEVYVAWMKYGLGMRGIFLDETPALWNAASGQFLETIAASIRSAVGGFGTEPLIIQNPGTIPDARYLASCSESVVFEGSYSAYQIYGFSKTIQSFRASAKCEREALSVIIHGLPDNLTTKDQKALITEVRNLAGSVFVTGLVTDCYAGFWQGWQDFVEDANS